MKKSILIVCALCAAVCAQAQYDLSGLMNWYFNEMNTIQENMDNNAEARMKVTASALPGGGDTYLAHVCVPTDRMVKYITMFYYSDAEDYSDLTILKRSECQGIAVYNDFITPPVLKPGYTFAILLEKDGDSKIVATVEIPKKGTASYTVFLQNITENQRLFNEHLSRVAAIRSGGTPSYGGSVSTPSSSGSSSGKVGTVCRSCKGTGMCGTCNGRGTYQGSYGVGTLVCPNCSASNGRICTVCSGTGKW
jgi:hypothetical protein